MLKRISLGETSKGLKQFMIRCKSLKFASCLHLYLSSILSEICLLASQILKSNNLRTLHSVNTVNSVYFCSISVSTVNNGKLTYYPSWRQPS